MTGTPSGGSVGHVGVCPRTGKRQYASRREARIIRRRMVVSGLSAYRCSSCPYWHLGNHGDLTRDQHRARRSA